MTSCSGRDFFVDFKRSLHHHVEGEVSSRIQARYHQELQGYLVPKNLSPRRTLQ